MGTLGAGTGMVLPDSSMLAVQPQWRTVMMVVAVVMLFPQMSQTSMKIVVMTVGWRVIEAHVGGGRVSGGVEVMPLLRLPPPGARMIVPLLSADVPRELVIGDDDPAELRGDDELWPVLEMPTGPTIRLPEIVELNTTAEIDDATTPGLGTKSVLL